MIIQPLENPVREKGVTYHHVQWDSQDGWIRASNTMSKGVIIPAGTKVEYISSQSVNKRKLAKIRWDGQEGWVEESKISEEKWDLTYATRFRSGEKTGLETKVPKQTRVWFEQEAATTTTGLTVKELAVLGRLIGHVSHTSDIYDDQGHLTPKKLTPGTYLVFEHGGNRIIEVTRGPARPGKLSRVTKLDDATATENWIRSEYVTFQGHEHGFTIQKENGQLILVTRKKMPTSAAEQPAASKYDIHPAVAQKIEQRYYDRVEQTIQSRGYTTAQESLLYYAKTFSQNLPYDQTKYPKPANLVPLENIVPLTIPEWAKAEAGEHLNEDLISRMQQFYRFLRHSDLITGPPSGIGGIRARTTAHEMSTKWTLNPKSGLLRTLDKKIEFTRRLASLEGRPDASNIHWLAPDQALLLAEAMQIINVPDTYQLSKLFLALSNYTIDEIIKAPTIIIRQFTPRNKVQIQQSLAITELYTLVEKLIEECRQRVTEVGNRRSQNAQAAEGFPKSEAGGQRRPNTNDKIGISNHCGGEAIDVTFPFKFNYYDPIIDAIALYFGLYRPVKDSPRSPEHWHYERVGIGPGERTEVESTLL